MKKLILSALLALIAAAPLGAAPPPGKRNVSFKDKLLGQIPDEIQVYKDVHFSFNGKNVAYTAVKGTQMQVYVNNTPGPMFPQVGSPPTFVKSGDTVVYRAYTGSGWCCVIGQRPGPAMANVGMPRYSPDYKRFAFDGSKGVTGARDNKGWAMFVDGRKASKDYASIGPPHFSPDNSICAHTVRIGVSGGQRAFHTVYAMVVNGKEGKRIWPDGKMDNPIFAPVGKRFAYRQLEQNGWSMIIDGKSEGPYAEMGDPMWSPDGKKCAYTATSDRISWYIVADGKKIGPYPLVGDPSWKPDNSGLAYKFSKEGKYFVMIDGKEHGPHPVAERPIFSADSKHWAYAAIHPRKWTVIHDGKPGPDKLDAIYGPIVLSKDGKHVAYRAGFKYKWVVVMDDGIGSMYDTTGIPQFNPAGTKLAYSARRDKKWYMVVHWRQSEAFDEIYTTPVWSADGSKVAFGCRKDRALYWRVIDVPLTEEEKRARGKSVVEPKR